MRILEVSCSYFPDKIGGTETYVRYLVRGLVEKGHDIFICYVQDLPVDAGPLFRIRSYVYEGIPVYVLEKNTTGTGTKDIYFQQENKIRPYFTQLLEQLKPEIIHFHHFSSTDIIGAAQVARERGIPTILTYHTPMMTCCQGQMLYNGIFPCEGKIEFNKCLECIQVGYSVPRFIAKVWARLPLFLARPLGRCVSLLNLRFPLATWLQLPWMEFEQIKKIKCGLHIIDYFVAVSEWVRALLLANGIKAEKIVLSRQGVEIIPGKSFHQRNRPLKAVFVGRIVPYKGLDVLFEAVGLLDPAVAIEIVVYGVPQDDREKNYLLRMQKRFSQEKRIQWKGILEPQKKFDILGQADVVVIPSLWQETGPLVLLEAWAAGVPVIGSRRGAIAELMTDNHGGLLFEPGDSKGLADILRKIVNDHTVLENLKKTIPAPKTMDEVVVEMEFLYKRIRQERAAGV